jgi:hypothetical protein
LAEPGSIYFSPTRLAVLKIYYSDVFPDRLEGLLNSALLPMEEWDRNRKDFMDSLLYIKKKYKNIYSAYKDKLGALYREEMNKPHREAAAVSGTEEGSWQGPADLETPAGSLR